MILLTLSRACVPKSGLRSPRGSLALAGHDAEQLSAASPVRPANCSFTCSRARPTFTASPHISRLRLSDAGVIGAAGAVGFSLGSDCSLGSDSRAWLKRR